MTSAADQNEHLVWSLEKVSDHQRATRFVMQFQKTLCVYSGPVQQLYSNYEIIGPEDNARKLLILPNPYAFHDTFNHIPDNAVFRSWRKASVNNHGFPLPYRQ